MAKHADERNLVKEESSVLSSFAGSFDRSLRALNRKPKTRETYRLAIQRLSRFLADQGMPEAVSAIRREHIEAFMAALLAECSAKTALTYYTGIRVVFGWLVEEGEIRASPMTHMHPPHVPEKLAPVLPDDAVRRLLRACEGAAFEDRRDMAIIRLFVDSGIRRSELAGLTLDDLDLDAGIVRVLGKGQRWRACPFGHKTAVALDRYLRVRARHPHAREDHLWLGRVGALTPLRINALIKRRGEQAGLPELHPHLFRHYFSHSFLAAGGQETDLLTLAGWRSRAMLQRYAASAASERARDAHKRLGLGDRF